MKVIRETCIAGAVVERSIKVSNRYLSKGERRKPRTNITRDAVQKNNDRIAAKCLARVLNANFYPGDWHQVLTYSIEPTPEEAKRYLNNFLNRMKREYKKAGKEFKCIAVTEYRHKRIHHHIVCPYLDLKIFNDQWKEGWIRPSALGKHRNYYKLANYLIKETSKSFREPEAVFKKRYSARGKLVKPIIKREVVSASELFVNDPKPLKGYQVERDTLRRYEHPYTGLEYFEFMMISTEEVPRLKQWRRGKIVKTYESLRRLEELKQLEYCYEDYEILI
ncbi:MAG: hypothetical protein JJE03_07755 [Peptostreptococcaceae bacterium]|nr:hypothetical protein [Peptostreptococcaceae bacterium]